MSGRWFKVEELRAMMRQKGFTVEVLANHAGMSVRTLQRRFREQLETSPKQWIAVERMRLAPALLAEGLSTKAVAATLSYAHESNFCRDFKTHHGCSPQRFAQMEKQDAGRTLLDKK